MTFRIATRGSVLARWQAEYVARLVREANPGIDTELVVVTTTGDRHPAAPLASLGAVGVFTREVDRAVLEERADAAVHSLKDMPTEEEPGLIVAAVPVREDPRDAFLPAPGSPRRLADLPPGAHIGTGSLRRRALLLARRPDLVIVDLRGNVETRLARLAEGTLAGTVLALAGLHRLDRLDVIGELLDPPAWLPAPGQGALAVTVRAGDARAARLVAPLDHAPTRTAVRAERALLRRLEGGCQVPIGALASANRDRLRIDAFIASPEGQPVHGGWIEGPLDRPGQLGEDLADALLHAGGEAVLERVRAHTGSDA